MKNLDPAEQVLIPAILSIRADTAQLLAEMASEMSVSIDELFSVLAEDSVIGLAKSESFFDDVVIPDRTSRSQLMSFLTE